MIRSLGLLLTAATMLGVAMQAPLLGGARPRRCETLTTLTLPNTTIETATSINPAPEWEAPHPAKDRKAARVLVPICRVVGVIGKEIHFEVWLPSKGWNGKYLGAGNGGYAGFINYSSMANAVTHGYATASTDTGHRQSPSGDPSWALGHPERVANYGYRAHHLLAQTAKKVISAFYGVGARYSLFASCSAGGYEGLMEAQRFPADYDGIVAGDPATSIIHLRARQLWAAQIISKRRDGWIPRTELAHITKAVGAACDAQDGVKDGLISNPLGCQFDYSGLGCNPGQAANGCLTPAQIEMVKKLYGPARDAAGKEIYPPPAPGTPLLVFGDLRGSSGGVAEKAADFFRYFVFENPDWDWRTSNIGRDVAVAESKLSFALEATDPNLKPFKARGGKLVIYNGWLDPAVSPHSVINYYKSVERVIGHKETQSFARLFLVPGMGHCGGGPGPNTFDMLGAINQWVSNSKPPDRVVASHITNGRVDRTRPLCPYPEIAQYKGIGSTDDAASFVCKLP